MERVVWIVSIVSVVLAIILGLFSAGVIWVMATSPVPHAAPAPGATPTARPAHPTATSRSGVRPTTPTPHPTATPRPTVTPTPQPTATPPPTPSAEPGRGDAPPTIFWQGSPNLHEVALTFDDGPSPTYTPQILAVLTANGVPATFFLIGNQAATYPSLVHSEAAAGMLVEDHSWSHPDLTTLSAAGVMAQLGDTAQAIDKTLGSAEVTLFRPPYGNVDPSVLAVAAQLHLMAVKWDVDPSDWARPGVSAIVNRVLAQTHNGAIILMHDGGGNRSETVAALPQIFMALRQRGYRFVTVPQLMADSGV
jgi:peptidoglycan/xylan/chitin deacetylase (PgdA/CDA1 family)